MSRKLDSKANASTYIPQNRMWESQVATSEPNTHPSSSVILCLNAACLTENWEERRHMSWETLDPPKVAAMILCTGNGYGLVLINLPGTVLAFYINIGE